MDIENQVCSIEQGERLKKLGILQKSQFYWTHSEKWGIMYWTSIDFKGDPTSVFLVCEILRMLPEQIIEKNKPAVLTIEKGYDPYSEESCFTVGYKIGEEWIMGSGTDSVAQSAADILILLIDRGYINSDLVNSYLNLP